MNVVVSAMWEPERAEAGSETQASAQEAPPTAAMAERVADWAGMQTHLNIEVDLSAPAEIWEVASRFEVSSSGVRIKLIHFFFCFSRKCALVKHLRNKSQRSAQNLSRFWRSAAPRRESQLLCYSVNEMEDKQTRLALSDAVLLHGVSTSEHNTRAWYCPIRRILSKDEVRCSKYLLSCQGEETVFKWKIMLTLTYIHNGYRDVSNFMRFYVGVLAVEGKSWSELALAQTLQLSAERNID